MGISLWYGFLYCTSSMWGPFKGIYKSFQFRDGWESCDVYGSKPLTLPKSFGFKTTARVYRDL